MLNNQIVVSIISLVAGAIITHLVGMLRSKTAVLHYSTNIQHTALAREDQIFGKIQVTWQDNDVNNVYFATINVENNTMRDFENLRLVVYTGDDTLLLSQRTAILETPDIVMFSPDYQAQITVPEGSSPTDAQLHTYLHRREYIVPVLNRGDKVQLSYSCTVPGNDKPPAIWLSSSCKGMKLKHQITSNHVFGVPANAAIYTGLIVAGSALVACGKLLQNVWLVATICTMIGLFAQAVGALLFRAGLVARRLIAG